MVSILEMNYLEKLGAGKLLEVMFKTMAYSTTAVDTQYWRYTLMTAGVKGWPLIAMYLLYLVLEKYKEPWLV